MNQSRQIFRASGFVVALATGALALTSLASAGAADTRMPAGMKMPTTTVDTQMPKTAAEYNAAAAKYDQEAVGLDAKAAHHAQMAALYSARATSGSKQEATFRTLANHCERLAESYRLSAAEARATAQVHRDMAKAA